MRNLFIFIVFILRSGQLSAQTITPIFFLNDSISVSKVQIINIKNGLLLKTNSENKLLNILEPYPDTIKIIIPFKNGIEIILDSVPTIYIDIACVIDAKANILAEKNCCSISYLWGDVIRRRTLGANCNHQLNSASISSDDSYYERMTKNLGVNLFDRMNSKEYFERMQQRNN